MKHSLRIRMTLVLTISMTALIALVWLATHMLLETYYLNKKVSSLSESYYGVNLVAGSGMIEDDDEISYRLERIEASNNVSVYIISMGITGFGKISTKFVYPAEVNLNASGKASGGILKNDSYDRVKQALFTYIFRNGSAQPGTEQDHLKTLEDRYDVYKFYDENVDTFYLDLVGSLDNDYIVFIRSNYENIAESSDISSRFLAIIGSVVIVLGSVVMFIFSKSFVKPIKELADISDQMANLNFENRYISNKSDEISKLGNSINSLSEKLEHTITELKTANLELEKDLADKTEIDNTRREFLSNISHELKTPIALIQGYAEGLQDNINDDPESREFYCDVIIDEAHKMNNLVKKLLSLNELELGRDIIDLQRFDIVELTRSISGSVEILAKQQQASIVFNEHEPIFVWADPFLIEEVITNYLSNALHYTDGRKIIDIGFEIRDKVVRVSVFNTGKQIPDEDLENIWDKFYKVDKARTREYGGSGIGLSVVKAIMDRHQQSYGVCNHSAGVEFWFELDIQTEE